MDNRIKFSTINMPSKKPQVSLRLEEHEYQELKEWAESEFRTPAALSAIIIKKTLTQRRISTQNTNINVDEPDAGTLLKLLAGGQRPGDGELLEVAQKTGIREEELLELRDRLFPDGNQQKKRKATNGV